MNAAQELVFGAARADLLMLDGWAKKHLRPTDALVIEMTTNTWQVYEELSPFVQAMIVVHPPHVALVTRAHSLP